LHKAELSIQPIIYKLDGLSKIPKIGGAPSARLLRKHVLLQVPAK
jgi:hypothetical protein